MRSVSVHLEDVLIATVEGGEAVGLNAGVGGDENIRDEVQAWPAVTPVAQENLTSEVSGRRGDGIVVDVEEIQVRLNRFHLRISDGKLRKGDGRDAQLAFAGRKLEAIPPYLPARLFSGEKEENGTVEGGAHGVDDLSWLRGR